MLKHVNFSKKKQKKLLMGGFLGLISCQKYNWLIKEVYFSDINAHGWWTDGLQWTNGWPWRHVWSKYGALWWYGHVPSRWTTLPKSVSFCFCFYQSIIIIDRWLLTIQLGFDIMKRAFVHFARKVNFEPFLETIKTIQIINQHQYQY